MVAAGPKGAHAGRGPMPWANWQSTDLVRRWEEFCRRFVVIPHGYGAGEPMRIYKPQRELRRGIDDHLISIQVVAKGNAKSSTAAPIGLHWIVDPPPGDLMPLVPVVAGSKEQARSGVYDTAVAMVKASETLSNCLVIYEGLEKPRIECPQTGGIMRPFAPTPRRLHSIIPSFGIADELGLIPDERVWQTIAQSIGKRPGSRAYGMGTPGWERGALFHLRQRWLRGELGPEVFWLENSAPPGSDVDDHEAWAAANPMRKAMNPKGWLRSLEAIRSILTNEDEFRIFHMAMWPEMTGVGLVKQEEWNALAEPLGHDEVPEALFVAIEGDYSRRSVAVVLAYKFDDWVHLIVPAVWEHQKGPVPVNEILEAALERGIPAHAVVRSAGQLDDVAEGLENEGCLVTRYDTSSAAKMRAPTDAWLETMSAGTISHDGAEALGRQMMATKLEPRREGLTVSRDERDSGVVAARIDAPIAAVIAVWQARTVPTPKIH